MSPSPSEDHHARAVVTAIGVTVLWSSSWVLIRWGLDDHGLRPVGFAGLRYGLAALLLATWVSTRPDLRAQLRRLTPGDLGRLGALGLVFYSITQGAQFVAIESQPAATTSLILSTTPLVVSVISRRLLGEPPTTGQVGGAALIAAGALAYFAGDLGFTPVGLTAALTALAGNTAASLLGRMINRVSLLSPAVVTLVSMGIGAAILVGAGAMVEGVPTLTPSGWLIVAWLAVVNTTVAFTWWNWSLRHLAASTSAAINNTILVQIALLGWVFLAEVPAPIQWLGMAAVSAGVYLAQRRRI